MAWCTWPTTSRTGCTKSTPKTNQVTVYRIPHREGEPNGGLLAARLKDFPQA